MKLEKGPLFDKRMIDNRVASIADNIDKDYLGEDLIIICVLKGAFMFVSDLIRYIYKEECIVDFVRISSYGSETTSSGKIKLLKDIEVDIKGKNVLIVDDILDTGLSLTFLVDMLQKREPKTLKTCVLLDKPKRRLHNINADYVGFEIEDKFVVGYGLDCNEKGRELADIYIVKEP